MLPVKPLASLSLDVDNQWTYMRIHGDAGWEAFPSYLGTLQARVLSLLGERGLRITCFVVGQDAVRDENAEPLQALSTAGHELQNHSFRHEPWLHRYSEAELDEELGRAEAAIETLSGVRPTGFRGPGYSLSETTLRVLARRGYAYDASTLPTYIGPLARAYYFRTARLSDAERRERAYLFGSWQDGRRPVGPYRFVLDPPVMGPAGPRDALLEIPVTTLPGVKVPIHVSYLLMLSERSPAVARAYLEGAITWCRAAGIEPSILLHPLDVLSGDDVPELAFFPGMGMPAQEKLARVGSYLDVLTRRCRVVPMSEHASALQGTPLPKRMPRFVAEERVGDAA